VTALLRLGFVRGRHVVAQVIETKFIVSAVGDIGGIRRPLLGRSGVASRQNQADIHTHEPVHATHQLGLVLRKVIVHRDQVNTFFSERVQVHRTGRREGFTLAGLHLRDPAEVQCSATHHLDIEVALPEHTDSGFARDGK
jgi:hypothetical protein